MIMRTAALLLARIIPGATRYFLVGKEGVDHVEIGLATLIRKRGGKCSYLYLDGSLDGTTEPVDGTPFFWGLWLKVDMLRKVPMKRELDELEAFVMIQNDVETQKKKKVTA